MISRRALAGAPRRHGHSYEATSALVRHDRPPGTTDLPDRGSAPARPAEP